MRPTALPLDQAANIDYASSYSTKTNLGKIRRRIVSDELTVGLGLGLLV